MPIPAAALERRPRARDLRPRLPSLYVMARLLQHPCVWAELDAVQRLIVQAAEQTAHRGEDAPQHKQLQYLCAVGAMFDVHFYCDSPDFLATPVVAELELAPLLDDLQRLALRAPLARLRERRAAL